MKKGNERNSVAVKVASANASTDLKENIAKYLFLSAALMSVLSLVVITFFIFSKGLPAIGKVGLFNFLFGTVWEPGQELFGILPMMLSSIVITAIAFFFGSYIGKWTATYLAFYCNKKLYKVLKPMVELLAGVPSVIFGFFGVVAIVPIIRDNVGGAGKSMLAAIIILIIMILPTIVNISEASLKAVPENFYEGALALGLTHDEAVFKVVVPAARSGIMSSYILGIGRVLGETMAIILVAGNSPRMPFNILKPIRTLTTGIAMEMGYASGLHQEVLFAIGIVLFIFIFILNLSLSLVTKKKVS